jgi:hypothetical protein
MLKQARKRLDKFPSITLARQNVVELALDETYDVAFSYGGVWYFVIDGEKEPFMVSHIRDDAPNRTGLEKLAAHISSGGMLLLGIQGPHFDYEKPISNGMTYALKAAEELATLGIEAEVIDLRTLRPMDVDTIIASVRKTGRCITVEEGWPQSGIGSEISAQVMEKAFDYLDAPVIRITGKDVPMPYAANLEKLALPNVGEVVEAARAVTYR